MREFFKLLDEALNDIESFPSYFMGASLCIDLERLGSMNVVLPSHGQFCWTYLVKGNIQSRKFNLDVQRMSKLRDIHKRYGIGV